MAFLRTFLNLGRLLKSFYMREKLFENPILLPGFRPGNFEFKVVTLANTNPKSPKTLGAQNP